MKRWRVAALSAALCAGCLEPMVGDDPGYSRYVLPQGSPVPSAYDDLQLNRKIDMQDGVTPPVKVKTGWANGQQVKYWDLGPAKRAAAPAYALTSCTDGVPDPNAPISRWPFIVETIPGDTDYSPYRAINWVCVTPKYNNEIITSSDALNDAIELGLVLDPRPADVWVNLPIVHLGVEVESPTGNRFPAKVYYKGKLVDFHSFEDQEGRFPYDASKPLAVGNAYDIVKIGFPGAVRTIFSQPFHVSEEDRSRNPAYSPQWMLYTVTLKALVVGPSTTLEAEQAKENADIESWKKEADIVTMNAMGTPTPMHSRVLSVSASTTSPRANRPFLVQGVAQ